MMHWKGGSSKKKKRGLCIYGLVSEWLLEPLSFYLAKAVFDTGKVLLVSADQESVVFCSMNVGYTEIDGIGSSQWYQIKLD